MVSIAVTPAAPNVPLGLTQQLTATGTFSDTSTANLTNQIVWTSGTPMIATVNASTGLANAATVGSTLITATSGSVSGSTTLNVTPAIVQSIAITPNPITAGTGISQQLTATGTYSDGTTQTVTTAANWTSGAPSVATVGPTTGLLTGVSNGSATISASIGSVTGTAPLSVVTDTWVLAGNMTAQRAWLTVTSLPNGTVLAAGGEEVTNGFSYGISSAEIYDPVTGTWSATGSMATPRFTHTATLLPNGQVLVAGGMTDYASDGVASTETYNPATGAWASSGNMSRLRAGHVAVLLPNGTVLVAGGQTVTAGGSGIPEPTATAEIYNPATGNWTPTGSMTVAIGPGMTATLLPNGTVLVVPSGTTSGAQIYDPVAGTWSATGSVPAVGSYPISALLPNGTVLVAGFISQCRNIQPCDGNVDPDRQYDGPAR
jgi:hypothetical protein